MLSGKQKFIFGILAALCFFNILAWVAVYDLSRPQFLEVNFFDVGQGDSIFIETPQRYQILIDGGSSPAILEKLAKEMPFYDRTIDLMILSHPEADHLTGLLEVLKKYKVKNILWTGIVRDTPQFKEWQKLIIEEEAKIYIAQAGQRLSYLEVLYPFENLEGKEFKDSNDTSIVVKLVFGKNSFLFTGDIYESAESELITQNLDIDSDVLKVSHHGSKTSSCEEFIKEVSPAIAVISVGKDNTYGHPHQETLETLAKYGIRILRTDEQGDIKIFSDGNNFNLKIKYQNAK